MGHCLFCLGFGRDGAHTVKCTHCKVHTLQSACVLGAWPDKVPQRELALRPPPDTHLRRFGFRRLRLHRCRGVQVRPARCACPSPAGSVGAPTGSPPGLAPVFPLCNLLRAPQPPTWNYTPLGCARLPGPSTRGIGGFPPSGPEPLAAVSGVPRTGWGGCAEVAGECPPPAPGLGSAAPPRAADSPPRPLRLQGKGGAGGCWRPPCAAGRLRSPAPVRGVGVGGCVSARGGARARGEAGARFPRPAARACVAVSARARGPGPALPGAACRLPWGCPSGRRWWERAWARTGTHARGGLRTWSGLCACALCTAAPWRARPACSPTFRRHAWTGLLRRGAVSAPRPTAPALAPGPCCSAQSGMDAGESGGRSAGCRAGRAGGGGAPTSGPPAPPLAPCPLRARPVPDLPGLVCGTTLCLVLGRGPGWGSFRKALRGSLTEQRRLSSQEGRWSPSP